MRAAVPMPLMLPEVAPVAPPPARVVVLPLGVILRIFLLLQSAT